MNPLMENEKDEIDENENSKERKYNTFEFPTL